MRSSLVYMERIMVLVTTLVMFAAHAAAQTAAPYQPERQVAAPAPKLAFVGAETISRTGKEYSKIIFTIQNRDKFDVKMFEDVLPLPPNPCGSAGTRIVAAIYSQTGVGQASCIPIRSRDSLGAISLLIGRDKDVPQRLYVVLTDRLTQAAYRSNSLSMPSIRKK